MMVRAVEEERYVTGERKKWGTWEELILGAAVLRLGTKDWSSVASLLQSKTPYPSLFTSQDCKAKYEELQQRYSACSAWFEELRKRRVAELKKALEESETSIGSLESKIEYLKAEKRCTSTAACSSSRAESSLQIRKSDEFNECSGKDVPKDGLSAGSYTQEPHPKFSVHPNIPLEASPDKAGKEPMKSMDEECVPSIHTLAEAVKSEYGVVIRKKRGQRKRKVWNARDVWSGEKNSSGSGNMGHSFQGRKKLKAGGKCVAYGVKTFDLSKERKEVNELVEVLNSVLENEQASIFQRKMDSQKRARYRKLVCQHVDLEMISSKISNKSISTIRELLRDLLLLANNALVFYSKTTREYKCALVLRTLVSRKLQAEDESLNKRPLESTPKHDGKPLAKPISTHPSNESVDKTPASTMIVTPGMTKGFESVNSSSINSKDKSSLSRESSLTKVKMQRRVGHTKKERVAGEIIVPLKPNKRPRAALK